MQADTRSSEEKMSSLSPWRHNIENLNFPSICWVTEHGFREKFSAYDANANLDIYSKKAALRISESVVSIVSHLDENMIFCASGTIIECSDGNDDIFYATLLSTGSLLKRHKEATPSNIKITVHLSDGKSYEGEVLAHDQYYNIAAIQIQSEAPLPPATLRHFDDSMSIDPNETPDRNKSFLRRHSSKFELIPGDRVIAVGRHHLEQHELMVAPGIFSADSCHLDCKELCRANCKITKSGIGGPLLNRDGEVIGINFYCDLCTPFLPIIVASKWWKHFKKYGEFRRPWLGMEITNLYYGRVHILERIIQKFPGISEGVIVERVVSGSPAQAAGIMPNDVIVQCDGKKVRSFLGLFKRIWGKVGQKVELVVLRPSDGARLNLPFVASEATRMNRWPLPEQCKTIKRIFSG